MLGGDKKFTDREGKLEEGGRFREGKYSIYS